MPAEFAGGVLKAVKAPAVLWHCGGVIDNFPVNAMFKPKKTRPCKTPGAGVN